MAGWAILADGSDLDCFEILRNLQVSGYCLDVDASSLKGCVDGGGKDFFRNLFDRIISVFLEEISVNVDVRPLPAILGDGRCVDLFKLFCVVRKNGGYDAVSKKGLWGLVAEESGLGSEVTSSVKLIHFKYLDLLDRWFQKVFADKGTGGGGFSAHGGNLGLLSAEFQTEFSGLLSEMTDQLKKHEDYPHLDLEKNGLPMDNMSGVGSLPELGGGKKCFDDDDDKEVAILDKEEFYSHKRKREECLLGMLNWVKEITGNPLDPSIGKSVEGKLFLGQALLAREALFIKKYYNSSTEVPLLQKKQKTHPLPYEDHTGYYQQSTEGLRISERVLSHKKSCTISCSNSSSAIQDDLNKTLTRCMAGKEIHPEKWLLATTDSFAENSVVGHNQKQVLLGPLFQAEVPEWTGVSSVSDSKWLGTRVWPPLDAGECNLTIEWNPVGKGRHCSCGCRLPGSVECVRFHIAEKRMRMKLELGSAFYHWRFNRMGEEVSLPWTEEEEKRFKAIVRLNPPSLGKSFWPEIYKYFCTKSRESLVSYYFNVFLLRRRSYQNRVTPNNINSDDDESEFGSVSNGFGYEAIKVPGPNSVFCAQNKECMYLD